MKNVMNINLEEDLKYESELNMKMDAEIWGFENEKARLLSKCEE